LQITVLYMTQLTLDTNFSHELGIDFSSGSIDDLISVKMDRQEATLRNKPQKMTTTRPTNWRGAFPFCFGLF